MEGEWKDVINGFGGRISGYNWTVFLSSPNPQPTPFFTSSSPPAWFTLAVFSWLRCLHPSHSYWSLLSSSVSCPVFFPFCLFFLFFMLPHSLLFSPPPPTLLPFLHYVHYPLAFGLLASIKVFSSSFFSLSLVSLHLSLQCPLIFMRLAGQPCSASLSLSVGEEAAYCQQLMDFWKTQTAMHHSLENQGEREKGFGGKPEGEWFQRDTEENIK